MIIKMNKSFPEIEHLCSELIEFSQSLCMDGDQFKDPVSCLCLCGCVGTYWSVSQEAGSSYYPFDFS